ncbi:MAG: helix-turn-helix transcriptional regulator [Phycisphaerae bacterium]
MLLIKSGPDWNPKRLAERCNTSERSIYRDLRALEEAGVHSVFDAEAGGYRLLGDVFMPPVQLTVDESLALVLLAESVAGGQVPLMQPALRAVEKVFSQLPPNLRSEVGELNQAIEIQLAASQPDVDGLSDTYETVREAIRGRRVLKCGYHSIDARLNDDIRQNETFLFEPYRLFYGQRAWYAVGHHVGRNDVRCLKLGRFTSCGLTDTTFEMPEDFSMDKFLGNAWRMIRGERRYAVRLRFEPGFAENVADTRWHHTQKLTHHDDGSLTFECDVDGLGEIVWWVMSHGPSCRVLAPAELARNVRELAEKLVEMYPPE